MTDFLGRLIQRSLPGNDRSASHTELAPRLPGLFEPTAADVSAPVSTEFSTEPSASTMRHNAGNMQTPHPSVVSQVRPSALRTASNPEPIRRRTPTADQGGESDRSASASHLQPSSLQLQVIRHQPHESSAQDEHPFNPLPPARLAPVLHTDLQMNRKSRRLENTAAMIDGPSRTTVRVSIGRIEVRAVQHGQPVPPARRTIPQTKMTLEEYAKQRNEGK